MHTPEPGPASSRPDERGRPRAVIGLSLSSSYNPKIARATPEESTVVVAHGAVLKLVPTGPLYTRRYDDAGNPIPIAPEHLLRYYFAVSIEDEEVVLEQVADEFGCKTWFSFSQGSFPLAVGKPVSIYLNVPGGGPEWTLALLRIEQDART